MKKLYLLFLCIITIAAASFASLSVCAYTQEEKQMVKDWLAAHGYSPDWGGAEQAYQDYLDGKIDMSAYGLAPPGRQTEPETEEAAEPETKTQGKKRRKKNKVKNETSEKETDTASVPDASQSADLGNQDQSGSVQRRESTANGTAAGTESETSSEPETGKSSSVPAASEPDTKTHLSDSGSGETSSETMKNTEEKKEAAEFSVRQLFLAVIAVLLAAIAGSFLYMRAGRKKK